LTPSSSADLAASGVIFTSNAKIEAYSFYICDSSPLSLANTFVAFRTSFLCTGPIVIAETGILAVVLRNSSSASSEPRVDA